MDVYNVLVSIPKGAGPSTSTGGFLSPISPYVLMEMRLGATPGMGGGMDGDATADGTEDLKNKWGFTPGAEDTLDVSHGECVNSEGVMGKEGICMGLKLQRRHVGCLCIPPCNPDHNSVHQPQTPSRIGSHDRSHIGTFIPIVPLPSPFIRPLGPRGCDL